MFTRTAATWCKCGPGLLQNMPQPFAGDGSRRPRV